MSTVVVYSRGKVRKQPQWKPKTVFCNCCEKKKNANNFGHLSFNKGHAHHFCKECVEKAEIEFIKLIEDIDLSRLGKSIVRRFRDVLSREQMELCRTIGLWKAILTYKERFGTTFQTHFCNHVRFMCLLEQKESQGFWAPLPLAIDVESPYSTSYDIDQKDLFKVCRSILVGKERVIFNMYFIDGYTYTEIGKNLNLSCERTCQIYRKMMARIKKYFTHKESYCELC